MTRRETLRAILASQLKNVNGIQVLVDDLDAFKESGKSGLDNWLEEAYYRFVSGDESEAGAEGEPTEDLRKLLEALQQMFKG